MKLAEEHHAGLVGAGQVVAVGHLIQHGLALGVQLQGLQAADGLLELLHVLVLEGEVEVDVVQAFLGQFQRALVVVHRAAVVALLAVDTGLVQLHVLVEGLHLLDGVQQFHGLAQAAQPHHHHRLAEGDVHGARMQTLGEEHDLLGLLRFVVLQVMVHDQLELLHIEEQLVVSGRAWPLTLDTGLLVVVTFRGGTGGFVHSVK